MFKINPNPTFNAIVDIPVPGGDAQPLTIVFKHKTRSQLKDYFERVSEGNDDADDLQEIIAGWDGMDTEFTEDALHDFLENYPSSAAAIVAAYGNELIRAGRKN